jgi:hypothetical protein
LISSKKVFVKNQFKSKDFFTGLNKEILVIEVSKDFDWYREWNKVTKRKDIIILAGDYSDIDLAMETRPEVKKLFRHIFDFANWEERDCVDLFERHARREGFLIGEGVRERVADECFKCRAHHSCDKGHDVDLLWELVKRRRALRVYETPETERGIQCDDHRALQIYETPSSKTKRTIQCDDMEVFD